MAEISRVLDALDRGDPAAAADLLPLVYAELRRLASGQLADERPGQTLSATALVHEAYLRLIGTERRSEWEGRSHFYRAAAEAMRRILIDAARRKYGPKRGGRRRVAAELEQLTATPDDPALLDLNEALEQLATESPIRAELVKLKFFAGLTIPESAAALGISVATAERYWAYARARLFSLLTVNS